MQRVKDRGPRLNPLRLSSPKNLTGQAEIRGKGQRAEGKGQRIKDQGSRIKDQAAKGSPPQRSADKKSGFRGQDTEVRRQKIRNI